MSHTKSQSVKKKKPVSVFSDPAVLSVDRNRTIAVVGVWTFFCKHFMLRQYDFNLWWVFFCFVFLSPFDIKGDFEIKEFTLN